MGTGQPSWKCEIMFDFRLWKFPEHCPQAGCSLECQSCFVGHEIALPQFVYTRGRDMWPPERTQQAGVVMQPVTAGLSLFYLENTSSLPPNALAASLTQMCHRLHAGSEGCCLKRLVSAKETPRWSRLLRRWVRLPSNWLLHRLMEKTKKQKQSHQRRAQSWALSCICTLLHSLSGQPESENSSGSHKGFAVHVITGLSFLLVKIAPTVVWYLVTTTPLSLNIIIIGDVIFLRNLKEERCTV